MNNRDNRYGRGMGDRDMRDDRDMGGRWDREREGQGRAEIDWDRARMTDDDRFGGASRGRQLSGSYGVRDDRWPSGDREPMRDFGGGFGGDARDMYDRREQRDFRPRQDMMDRPGEYSGGGYRGTGYGMDRYGARDEGPRREGMMERIGHWFERKLHMKPGERRGPKNYRRSDDRIREDVCDRLMTVDWLDASDVDIAVASGEITLTGTVPDRYMKRYIEEVAESVLGVTEVQNSLRVRRPEEQMLTPTGGQPGSATGQTTTSPNNGQGTSATQQKTPDKLPRA